MKYFDFETLAYYNGQQLVSFKVNSDIFIACAILEQFGHQFFGSIVPEEKYKEFVNSEIDLLTAITNDYYYFIDFNNDEVELLSIETLDINHDCLPDSGYYHDPILKSDSNNQ